MPSQRVVLPTLGQRDMSWQARARCAGTPLSLWFSNHSGSDPGRESGAKAICAACPVKDDCLDHAVSLPEPCGIWGGTTWDERKRMRRNRRTAQRRAVPA